MSKYKAYRATSGYVETHEIVFAVNAGAAKSAAVGLGSLSDAEFLDIRVTREADLDKFYKGHSEISWNDLDAQKVMRAKGWWMNENFDTCGICGLYVYDDLSESHLNEDFECFECEAHLTNQEENQA